MILRIVLLLLLCSASLPLLANEGQVTTPDGDGDCATAMGADKPDGSRDRNAEATDPDSVSRDKAAPPSRDGNAEGGVHGPRMHNLLPGMFR